MWDHMVLSATRHRLTHPTPERPVLDLPTPEGWKAELTLVSVIYKDGLPLNRKLISELRSVTCCMGSHSVSCHPTQVNAPRLNPGQTGRYIYSIYLPPEEWKVELTLALVIYT